ncbi:Scarecrow-like protein 14 [Morella rubra]|uniref:Scarecrow-like protein 14 n=1 Tax=Morella rubra TaxID=262757 RepID=A0A6A1UNM5_9ROSI|nr:Scarecrow-like protein 14 [Morella rubra]
MVMGPSFAGLPDFNDRVMVGDTTLSPNSDQYPDLVNEYQLNVPIFPDHPLFESQLLPPDEGTTTFASPIDVGPAVEPYAPSFAADSLSPPSMGTSSGEDWSSDVCDCYSEMVLNYMSQILMEENVADKPSMFHDPLGLQVTEKAFYDALGQKYPPSPKQYQQPLYIDCNAESSEDVFSGISGDCGTTSSSSHSTSSSGNPYWLADLGDFNSFSQATLPGDYVFQPNLESNSRSQFLANPLITVTNSTIGDGTEVSSQNIFTDSQSMLQFQRGQEEASKFLPGGNPFIGLEGNMVSSEWVGEDHRVEKGEGESSPNGSRGRKNHERKDTDFEDGRSNKQSAVSVDEIELSKMFDDALSALCCKEKQTVANMALQRNEQAQAANGGKSRAKKQGKEKDTVDLNSLLILCAQAVSGCDTRTANELLKQIRQHSSPLGDGSQRLAHFFANALEARLAGTGTGTHFYNSIDSSKISAFELLKAYKFHLSACPFKKVSIIFAVKMIIKVAEKATSLHIVDFGIQYGFPWPILIKIISERPGGPPKLRITGIELPQPGFRPTERIEETGRRLAKYCEEYNVPFEYHAIASKSWETIQIKDLKIERNEMLAVNCLYRFKNLFDESVEENSPRNAVLNLIRRMNPDIFVHSIVNGAYNAAFFVPRFREALYHFSALYDMFDVTLPREDQLERLMFEREFFGREAMNVIACESSERVERPETYRQWQARTVRAGFKVLPLDQELVQLMRSKLKELYHKDFVLDEDNHWILQGWKGRIVFASSCWVPA